MEKKKYYLVNYTHQPARGTSLSPLNTAMFEFDESKNIKECYDEIYADLNRGGDSGNIWKAFRCTITDMKRID